MEGIAALWSKINNPIRIFFSITKINQEPIHTVYIMFWWATSFSKVFGFPQKIPNEILNFESLCAVRAQHSNSNSGKRAPWNPQRFSLAAFHYSGCHSSERNDTPEAQGDRSVTSHLDTWAESATPIIDRWRPFTGYLFSETDVFWYGLSIFRYYRQMAPLYRLFIFRRYIFPKIKYVKFICVFREGIKKNHL